MEMKHYDVIIMGSGPGAMSAAHLLRNAGESVMVVEAHRFGGTCPNSGCDPKKILTSINEVALQTNRMDGLNNEAKFDWPSAVVAKHEYTKKVPDGIKSGFAEQEIDCTFGHARFTGKNEVSVGNDRMSAKRIIVATGAKPRPFNFPGSGFLTTSEQFLDLPELPEKIVFLGAGYITFELAQLAAADGKEVHVVHHNDQALKAFDQDLVETLVERSIEKGIHFHWNTTINRIEEDGKRLNIHTDDFVLYADQVVHGAGRVPNVGALDLEQADIQSSKTGIAVNENMQSVSNAHVYAVGGVADTKGLPLTPLAGEEGKTAANHILSAGSEPMDYTVMPSVIYTVPKLAKVGLTESEAKEQGLDYKCIYHDTTKWLTYRVKHEEAAHAKILVDQQNKIIGAHFLSEEADELVNYFSMLMQLGVPTDELKRLRFAYPTVAGDLGSLV